MKRNFRIIKSKITNDISTIDFVVAGTRTGAEDGELTTYRAILKLNEGLWKIDHLRSEPEVLDPKNE
jgi:hypothetical protein